MLIFFTTLFVCELSFSCVLFLILFLSLLIFPVYFLMSAASISLSTLLIFCLLEIICDCFSLILVFGAIKFVQIEVGWALDFISFTKTLFISLITISG